MIENIKLKWKFTAQLQKMCITLLSISTDERSISIFSTIHNYLFYSASKNELKACEIKMKSCSQSLRITDSEQVLSAE